MHPCTACGRPMPSSFRFCDECGNPLTQVAGARRRVRVGRGPDNDLVVPQSHPGVSRNHANFTLEGGQIFLEDLGSPNGTFLNGQPVRGRVAITMRDHIQLGPDYLVNKGLVRTLLEGTTPLPNG